MLYTRPRYRLMGDRALLVELGEGIHRDVNRQVQKLFFGLDRLQSGAIRELQPGYRSLTVVYDPLKIALPALKACIESVFRSLHQFQPPEPAHLQVPVAYGGEFGPDIERVANHNRLTMDEVASKHIGGTYTVRAVGFSPG